MNVKLLLFLVWLLWCVGLVLFNLVQILPGSGWTVENQIRLATLMVSTGLCGVALSHLES